MWHCCKWENIWYISIWVVWVDKILCLEWGWGDGFSKNVYEMSSLRIFFRGLWEMLFWMLSFLLILSASDILSRMLNFSAQSQKFCNYLHDWKKKIPWNDRVYSKYILSILRRILSSRMKARGSSTRFLRAMRAKPEAFFELWVPQTILKQRHMRNGGLDVFNGTNWHDIPNFRLRKPELNPSGI